MIFRQLIHDDLGCASYLIGDQRAGVAAVVDPRFDIADYLEVARYVGVTITHIFETHNHADHVSGHGRLVAATGATVHVHRLGSPAYDHEPFEEGDEFELGELSVRILHTPGHRPEHSCLLLIDHRRGEAPWALLSGDSLFVGDVARPDLAIENTEGARGIFSSLRDKILTLPDEVEIWPGHIGGSMCGGPGMDMKVCSTVGYERVHNPMLQIDNAEQFVARSLADLGPQPPNFQMIVDLNRGPFVTEAATGSPLTSHRVEEQRRAGALLVDVRTSLEFDDAHIPGAVSIPMMKAGFATRLAWIAAWGQAIIFIGRDDDDGRRGGYLALAIGLTNLPGYLSGGMRIWRQEARVTGSTERLAAEALPARVEADDRLRILDVRETNEFAAGHIPGSIGTPWHDIDGLPDGIDAGSPTAIICASGERAGTAASLLELHGASNVIHVIDGGFGTWRALGHPVVAEQASAPA